MTQEVWALQKISGLDAQFFLDWSKGDWRVSKYNPNLPFWIKKTIARAERSIARDQARLEVLKTQQAINDIDIQLKRLNAINALYPPHKADDDALSCAVHTAPLSS